jgi:hypothetical protein
VGVDPKAVAVDDNVVVEPTQRREVRWVVCAALTAGFDVVGLEAVAGPTPVDGASSSVAVDDVAAKFGRDGPGGRSDRQWLPAWGCLEDFHGAVAQDLLQGERTDPRSQGDFAAGFPVGCCG